jgi:hypothetical protein
MQKKKMVDLNTSSKTFGAKDLVPKTFYEI